MEKFSFKKMLAPAIVATLGVTACGGESTSVEDQLRKTHAETAELCTDQAQTAFDEKYPTVQISDNPTTEELRTALETSEAREAEGIAFFQNAFETCVEVNFNDVADSLTVETPMPKGMEQTPTSTIASETTEG
jgi:hypothetical protein